MDTLWQIITSVGYLFLMALPFAVFFFLVETMNKAEKGTKFFKSDFKLEVLLIITNKIFDILLVTSLVGLYYSYFLTPYFGDQAYNLLGWLPILLQLPISLMVYDFFSYWRHRLLHMYLWPVHAVHHSAEEITWITRHRFHPIEHVMSIFFEITILFFLGVAEEVIVVGAFLLTAVFYLSHANIKLKYYRPFRYMLISPHFHRWHHANQKEAYDKNFCGTFPFWDLLFGTYYHPEELPGGYGLSENEREQYSNTLIGSLFYPFVGLFKRFFNSKIND